MSAEQTRRNLNQLDRDLSGLENKLAEEVKKEADKNKRINDTQRSITKNTSPSTLRMKTRQIQGYQNELVKISSRKADLNKRIAEKRKKRAETAQKLQKEELEESKKIEKTHRLIYENYEKRIADLSSQLTQRIETQQRPKHTSVENEEVQYDVFISHAFEDKESFANDLCEELKTLGVKVWYDTLNIKWGDSLRAKIDDGLIKSKYGIVILSRDYICKGWTKYELDGLFQREMTGGKTVLPIWHNITKKEVQEFSPSLAGKLALNTSSYTAKEIALELVKILELAENQEEQQNG